MGKGSQTTSSTSAPNPQAMQAYQDLLTRAGTAASTPYQSYSGELVAPQNAEQNAGVAGINQYSQFAQPYIQQAAGMATSAASPITAQQIQNYESPYTQQVVDATQAQFNNQNQQQMQGVKGNAIAQGALGGNREAVAEAETANQQQLAQAPVIAGLQNQGYTTGLNTALTEQQALASGAYSLGNLGVSGQNAGLTGANAQYGAGTAQQQTQQAQDTAGYQQFQNQQAYPYQQAQWLAGLDTGVGSQMGGTSSTTAPAPSSLNSFLGLGAAGVGAVGQAGGWAALAAMMASGGAVGRASGGVAPDPHPTVPEPHGTLVAQQRQLVSGHRRVQMFPHGTRELGLPHGMRRVEAHSGVFHYDPKEIHPDEIRDLATKGRENELLDLGPIPKHEVLARIERGELPLAIVERQPDGTEVRAAAGTHLTAHHQMVAMRKTKSPGNHLSIEDVRHTLAHRVQRGAGGYIPHFDTGGGVANPAFNPSTAGMPYSGGQGWVPSNQITRGSGAPRPPGAPQQDQSVAKMGDQIGAMAKSITAGNAANNKITSSGPFAVTTPNGQSSYGLSPGDISSTPSDWGIGGNGANGIVGSAGDMMVPTFAKDGGSIGRYAGGVANLPTHNRIMVPQHFADGGSPGYDDGIPFDPNLGGIAVLGQYNVDPEIDRVAKSILSGGHQLPATSGFDESPLDNAQWPAGPVNAPGATVDGNGPSPLDTAPYPAGPVGAPEGVAPPLSFGDRFAGDPMPPRPAQDSGIAALSPAPLDLPAARFLGPAAVVTGTQAIPPAAAADISTPTSGYANNMRQYGRAIKSIESNGGDYSAVGPATKTGDHAYGAHQIMGANIPQWTKEVLGTAMTPHQFLNNPDAQETVFNAKFGQLVNKYGPEGAAKAWFAGEGGMHNPDAADVNGMTVARYGKQFMANLNGASPDGGVNRQTASRSEDSGDLPANARPTQHQGVAPTGIDWSENGKLWPALMAAGFGMMASRSPFPGVAIGEGGQQGMQTYSALKQHEDAQRMSQSKIDLEAKKLADASDIAHQKLALATKPYEGMTAYQKAMAESTERYRQGLLDRDKYRYEPGMGMHPETGEQVPGMYRLPTQTSDSSAKPEFFPGQTITGRTQRTMTPIEIDREARMRASKEVGKPDDIQWLGPAGKNNGYAKAFNDAVIRNQNELRQRYNIQGPGGAAPQIAPSAAPLAAGAAAPAAAAAAAPPPRPATVPADAKPQRNKATGAVRWIGADGSIYSADGARQK